MTLNKKIKDKKVNFEFNKEYIKVVTEKIASNDALFITNSFKEMHPADAADIIEHLSLNDRESLIKLNFLNGIDYDNNVIYLSQERFNTKSSLYNISKKAIAKKAFSYIKSGQIIALDGGSTTLELTRLICKNLKLKKSILKKLSRKLKKKKKKQACLTQF